MRDSPSTRFIRFHLKTRHLVLLVELGRHPSILHAAEAAGLTQPGASKLLGELEHALGVPLFERLPRGVVPTWYGQVLIRRAGAALAEIDAAHQEITARQLGFGGQVALGSVRAPSVSLLPRALKLLKEGNPRIQVRVAVDTSEAMLEQLLSGELDIVIGRLLAPDAELDFEPLADEPYSLIVRAGHPWLARGQLDVTDLAGAAWILPPPGRLRDQLMALFIAHGQAPPDDVIETVALPLVRRLLADSDRVVALQAQLVQDWLDAGTLALLPLDVKLRAGVYGIVTRRRHHLSPSAAAMLAALRQAAGLVLG